MRNSHQKVMLHSEIEELSIRNSRLHNIIQEQ
jgi:hypothetical protein